MKRIWWLIIAAVLITISVLIFLQLKKNSPAGAAVSITGRLSASKLQAEAKELENKGDLSGSKAVYQKLAADFSGSNEVANWQKKIEDLNIKLLFSPTITPKSTLYQIKPGDTLGKIARAFNTTVELIKKSNNLSDDKIIPGKKIKVWTAPFSILVDKSQNILILKNDEEVVKTYIVATGANNSTPVGTFKIIEKLPNPTWFKAGAVVAPNSPDNVLGTRWMGFDIAGYGIHGTIEPQSLGKQVTQGCVRMANPEVEELYTIVPKGTEVTIVD
ncbi:MAG: L,D-transpeptidase family protein [Candidatus Omnitrophica bacterium]|nr:L,D-transpeptidase family protein [Candidatus Omnitrophota bacterium]MDD5652565.1 L,D-transpeptidase family protein [Candidatus Omnitrophota bacterium]